MVLGVLVAGLGSPAWVPALPCTTCCSSPGLGNPHPKTACRVPSCRPPSAWQQVEQQLDSSRSGESVCGPVQYVEKTPNPGLKSKWEAVGALRGALGSWVQ